MRRAAVPIAAGLLSPMLFAGCQGEPTKPSIAPTSPPAVSALITDNVVASVTVVPDSQLTLVGERFKITAKPKNAAGQVLTRSVRWTVSDATIAKALDSLKATMTFKALRVGSTSIKATVDGKYRSSKVVVRSTSGAKVVVTPATAAVARGGTVRFSGTGVTQAGETAVVTLTWTATGGTISGTGVFTAGTATGTFRVIGTSRFGAADTSRVTITDPLAKVILVPSSAAVTVGGSVAFTTYGLTGTGDSIAVPVTYTATGGTIASTGGYTAGSTAGTYRVIAKNSGGPADTSQVVISTAATARVLLMPGTAASRTGATTSFVASVWNTLDQSVTASPTYQTTCGTVTGAGLFTAPNDDTDDCVVTAAFDGKADTTEVVLLEDNPSRGVPLGLFGLWKSATAVQTAGVAPYTASFGNEEPGDLVNHISAARTKGIRLVLALTGGAHDRYKTDGVFDLSKWQARMDSFDSPSIKEAVAQGVADGTIIGNSVMDEPQQSSSDSKSWGPKGTMTKLRVDGLCAYVKAIFPTLPVGVVHDPTVFEPDNSYGVCDFMLAQYALRKGDVTTWRETGLTIARRDGMAIIFSLNVLNGGKQDKDGVWDCPNTGGLGTYSPNCRMTSAQVRDWGNLLGPAGCAMYMWRYDGTFMAKPENQAAISDIAINLSRLARTPCIAARTSNLPPTAGFASSCNDLTCSFSNGSGDADGTVTAWHWEFGDGATSTVREPSHTYAGSGDYAVTLVVTDNDDATGSVTHTVTVTAPPPANTPPLAAFSSNCTDLSCNFADESVDEDGSLTEWSWNFGDGNSSTEREPSHTYEVEGAYQVTLVVTDDDTATGEATRTVTVTAPPPGP